MGYACPSPSGLSGMGSVSAIRIGIPKFSEALSGTGDTRGQFVEISLLLSVGSWGLCCPDDLRLDGRFDALDVQADRDTQNRASLFDGLVELVELTLCLILMVCYHYVYSIMQVQYRHQVAVLADSLIRGQDEGDLVRLHSTAGQTQNTLGG